MTIDFNLVSLLDLLAFVQGTLLGVLLMFKKKEHLSYFLLGLFLFTYSSELLVSVFMDSGIFEQKPAWLYLPITFNFWFMPALFLYVKSLSQAINWRQARWLFLPGLIEIVMTLGLFLQPMTAKLAQFENNTVDIFYTIYTLSSMIYSIIYIFIILRLLRQHQSQVKNYYSNVQGKLLNWIQWICWLILLISLFLMTSLFVADEFYADYLYPVVSAFNVVFIFWVALSGFRQKIVALPSISEESLKKTEDASKIDITSQEFEKVLSYLQHEKTYKQPDLHLTDLAKQLRFSQRHLSELINKKAGVNFNQFINRLRVEEAKRLLADEKYAHLNILGIGFEVGFNSKTSFYTAFKKEVGLPPSQFQKQAKPTNSYLGTVKK